jgi:hypothetical protein
MQTFEVFFEGETFWLSRKKFEELNCSLSCREGIWQIPRYPGQEL